MEAEVACIFCNWVNDVVWPYFGVGAAAAAAAAAASGSFGEGGSNSGGADDAGADDSNPEDIPDLYRDSSGNYYWPGVSPIPADGVVYPTPYRGGVPEGYLPVDPKSGMPIRPRSVTHEVKIKGGQPELIRIG
ncbi:MAG: hypothetical protein M3P32_03635 [Chloroflexota bacterium]|nr:hypothetical protein [Chloroflexota bacterium]